MSSLIQYVASGSLGVARDMGVATIAILPEFLATSAAVGYFVVGSGAMGLHVAKNIECEDEFVSYMNSRFPILATLDSIGLPLIADMRDSVGDAIGIEDQSIATSITFAIPGVIIGLLSGAYIANRWRDEFWNARNIRQMAF